MTIEQFLSWYGNINRQIRIEVHLWLQSKKSCEKWNKLQDVAWIVWWPSVSILWSKKSNCCSWLIPKAAIFFLHQHAMLQGAWLAWKTMIDIWLFSMYYSLLFSRGTNIRGMNFHRTHPFQSIHAIGTAVLYLRTEIRVLKFDCECVIKSHNHANMFAYVLISQT